MALLLHPELDPVVEVRGVRAHERGEVPRAGPRTRVEAEEPCHILEHAAPAAANGGGGEEQLLIEGRLALPEQTMHQGKRLDRDGPGAGAHEAARHGGRAGGDTGAGVARQREDLLHVGLDVGGEALAMRRGTDDGHLEVRGNDVGAGGAGQPDGRLVLGRAQRLPELAWRHIHAAASSQRFLCVLSRRAPCRESDCGRGIENG